MAAFEHSLAILARLNDATLEDESPWRGGAADVRYVVVYRALEREQDAAASPVAWPARESAVILAMAQTAFGDLRGLLCGMPPEALDAVPGEGQWTIRETLAHTVHSERSYLHAVRYALERREADPVERPAALRPAADPQDTAGDPVEIAERLARRRAETDLALAALDPPHLDLPSVWSGFEVDLRFRLHRFASHIVEHTIQAETALEAIGIRAGDAPRAARRISALRGGHERRTPAETLAHLDTQLAAALA